MYDRMNEGRRTHQTKQPTSQPNKQPINQPVQIAEHQHHPSLSINLNPINLNPSASPLRASIHAPLAVFIHPLHRFMQYITSPHRHIATSSHHLAHIRRVRRPFRMQSLNKQESIKSNQTQNTTPQAFTLHSSRTILTQVST